MIELIADGWYNIRGRGWVAAISNIDDCQLRPTIGLEYLLGRTVRIDGKFYEIIGVDRQGNSRRQFGLLVRGEK